MTSRIVQSSDSEVWSYMGKLFSLRAQNSWNCQTSCVAEFQYNFTILFSLHLITSEHEWSHYLQLLKLLARFWMITSLVTYSRTLSHHWSLTAEHCHITGHLQQNIVTSLVSYSRTLSYHWSLTAEHCHITSHLRQNLVAAIPSPLIRSQKPTDKGV
jgi:hypothetical protein